MPFGPRTFDLVYSSGLFHELDVKERTAEDALRRSRLRGTARRKGRDQRLRRFRAGGPARGRGDLERELRREAYGSELYGIGPPERLVALHETLSGQTCGGGSRRLTRSVTSENWSSPKESPRNCRSLPPARGEGYASAATPYSSTYRREGYTRPATLYVEGQVQPVVRSAKIIQLGDAPVLERAPSLDEMKI